MPFNIHLRNRIINIKSSLKCFNQFDQSSLSLCQIFTPLAHIGRCPDHYSNAIIPVMFSNIAFFASMLKISHAKLLEVKMFTLKRLSLRNSCANLYHSFVLKKARQTQFLLCLFHFVLMTEFCTQIEYIIKLVYKTEYILLPPCHCCYIFVYSLTYE